MILVGEGFISCFDSVCINRTTIADHNSLQFKYCGNVVYSHYADMEQYKHDKDNSRIIDHYKGLIKWIAEKVAKNEPIYISELEEVI